MALEPQSDQLAAKNGVHSSSNGPSWTSCLPMDGVHDGWRLELSIVFITY